jgi:hypothetical protein
MQSRSQSSSSSPRCFGRCAIDAAPIRIRLIEGNFRGSVVLRSLDGVAIAYGEVSQKPTGNLVECRTILRFKDGSLFDESATFSQKGVFRLEGYRLVQVSVMGTITIPAVLSTFDQMCELYGTDTRLFPEYKKKWCDT